MLQQRTTISFMSNRFLVVVLIGSLVVLSWSQYHKWQERKKIDRQIQALKDEAAQVDEKNKQLEESLKYLSTNAATERLARQQLNMKKEGEIAVVFMAGGRSETASATTQAPIPSWRLWWEYFFKH